MKGRKLIFLDIDGTLVMPGRQVSDLTKRAISDTRANGHRVFLCTGRAISFLPPELSLDAFDGGIFSAGAYVLSGGRLLLDKPLPEAMRLRITAALDEAGVYFNYETAQGSFACNRPMVHLEEAEQARASSEVLRVLEMLKRFPKRSLEDYRGEPVYKISFRVESLEQGGLLRDALPETHVVLFENPGFGLPFYGGEISAPGVTKATAMDLLCRELGCIRADCIAFGDSMNDAEILEAAGLGVAMGNAEPEVKALADCVCESCGEDGAARMLERLGLTKA